jgi:hypothetical protein
LILRMEGYRWPRSGRMGATVKGLTVSRPV